MNYKIQNFISTLKSKIWLTTLTANIYLIFGILFKYSSISAISIFILPAITTKRKELLIGILFFMLGCFSDKWSYQEANYSSINNKPRALCGCVVDCIENQMRKFPFSYKINGSINNQAGNYLLYTKNNLNLSSGDQVEIFNVKPSKKISDGFKQYLQKEGVLNTIFTNNPKVKIVKNRGLGIESMLKQLKLNTLKNLQNKLSPDSFSLFASIFMGNKSECATEYEQHKPGFKHWGLSHLLARSGLHLVIFVIALTIMLNLLQLNFFAQQVVRIVVVVFYYLLSWPSASFNRAFLFFMLWELCGLCHVQKNYINLLNIVCILTLLYNPILILFIEFQLSFLLTYILAFLIESNRNFNLNS